MFVLLSSNFHLFSFLPIFKVLFDSYGQSCSCAEIRPEYTLLKFMELKINLAAS